MAFGNVRKIGGSGGLSTGSPGQNVSNTFKQQQAIKQQQASNVANTPLLNMSVSSSDEDNGIGLNEIDEILEKSRDNALPTQTFGGRNRYIDLGGENSTNDWNITKFNIYVKPEGFGNSSDNVDLLLEMVGVEGNSNRNIELSINKNFEIITPGFSNDFETCVINALKEAQKKQVKQSPTSDEEIDCQFSLESGTIIKNAKFEGSYGDIFSEDLETPNRMTFEELQKSKELLNSSYAITRCTGFRDFVFKIWMVIWGLLHLEFKFVKNNGATNKLCEALRNNNSNLPIENLDNLEVIDTPRDGNCMLWSALISIFGADMVRDNFSYFRNSVIPWLRGEIAKAQSLQEVRLNGGTIFFNSDKDNSDEDDHITVINPDLLSSEEVPLNARGVQLTKHLGLGAAPIRPDEMGAVAKSLRRNIFIVADIGGREASYAGYAFTSDGKK